MSMYTKTSSLDTEQTKSDTFESRDTHERTKKLISDDEHRRNSIQPGPQTDHMQTWKESVNKT